MIARSEYCIVAWVDALRGSGEILVSPFGIIPTIAARLARLTVEPDILLTDGEARALRADGRVEGWLPFRFMFDLLSAGRRHVIMMPAQLDPYGNMNLSCIGDHARPRVQLIGSRGAPGNAVSHPTSYWVPRHSPRTFVERVDFVSAPGINRGGHPAWVVTNLAVFDFGGTDGRMRLRFIHPGTTIHEVREATGFEVEESHELTRDPTPDELALVRDVLDPAGARTSEVP